MKAVVDRTLCEDNGICVGAAPEIFDLDDGGRLVVAEEHPPEQRRRTLEDAVMICPVQALSIDDED